MKAIIRRCATTARQKGFKLNHHATQIALIATEVGEALDELHVDIKCDPATRKFINTISEASMQFEQHRANTDKGAHIDISEVDNVEALVEELCDVVIRVFTYVGGNNMSDLFLDALEEKMLKNESRPALHGKRF